MVKFLREEWENLMDINNKGKERAKGPPSIALIEIEKSDKVPLGHRDHQFRFSTYDGGDLLYLIHRVQIVTWCSDSKALAVFPLSRCHHHQCVSRSLASLWDEIQLTVALISIVSFVLLLFGGSFYCQSASYAPTSLRGWTEWWQRMFALKADSLSLNPALQFPTCGFEQMA